jgi:hypothetical protein
MAPKIWYADQIAHMASRGPSDACRQYVDLAEYRRGEVAIVILGEIAALVPLSETLDACKTGKTLVEWLKARLAIASQLQNETKP